jgi:hypothetical protein
METKQTAVEWLVEQFNLQAYTPHIEQAKQMEKEQIKQAFKDCHDLGHIYGLDTEQYYNETYGKVNESKTKI